MNASILLTQYLRRPPLRVQLTALYAGLALGVVAAVLLATGVLYRHDVRAAGAAGTAASIHPAAATSASRHFEAGPAAIGLIAVLVAVALAWWLAGRFLRPLRAITTAAQEISASDLHRRLNLNGPEDELSELGRTLDDLFARLEASFESQRHFVANASHELRTPLAGQRTLLQVALANPGATADNLRATCEEALELGAQQERLISGLLSLAIGENGVEQRETLDLAGLTTTLLDAHQHEADRREVTIRTSLERALITGDRDLIERMTANLLENAIRHNTPNGTITIATSRANDRTQLSIKNSGPVIQPDDVQRLLQPFQRLISARIQHPEGQGLGLAIVKAITDAHHATLTVTPFADGGLDVTVTFRE